MVNILHRDDFNYMLMLKMDHSLFCDIAMQLEKDHLKNHTPQDTQG